MAKQLFGFTQQQVNRVGRVVRAAETSGPPSQNRRQHHSQPTPPFWAELTGESPTNAGHYSWKKKYPKQPADGTYEDADPSIDVADFTAREINLVSGQAGKIVKLTFIGYDAAGKASYEFAAVAGVFPVLVEKDGGSDGTKTIAASWTYTVRSLNGSTTLGTAVVLTRPRPFGKMTFQPGSSGYGLAFYNDSNTLILWDAGEKPPSSAGC